MACPVHGQEGKPKAPGVGLGALSGAAGWQHGVAGPEEELGPGDSLAASPSSTRQKIQTLLYPMQALVPAAILLSLPTAASLMGREHWTGSLEPYLLVPPLLGLSFPGTK